MRENPEVKEHLCVGTCKTEHKKQRCATRRRRWRRRDDFDGVDDADADNDHRLAEGDDDETPARSARGEEGVAEGIAPGGGRARPVWVSVLHDDARRVMATIGDERERNHTPVGVVRNDVARARFIRGIGTVRSRESAGWVATGHGRRE